MFYTDAQNRFIFLIEQIRLALLSGVTVEGVIKYFSGKFREFGFLEEVSKRIGEGKELGPALQEQMEHETSSSIKGVLEALTAGDFAAQKLEELQKSLIKKRKEDFEKVSSSLTKKIGILAMIALLPVGIYFLTSIAEILQSVGIFEFSITQSHKIVIIAICSVAYIGLLVLKRVKNG